MAHFQIKDPETKTIVLKEYVEDPPKEVEYFAEKYGFDRRTILRWISESHLPYLYIRRKNYVKKEVERRLKKLGVEIES